MLGLANITPVISLAAGILVLICPKILNYVIAVYLILNGIMALVNHM
jgi:hypothetical protein